MTASRPSTRERGTQTPHRAKPPPDRSRRGPRQAAQRLVPLPTPWKDGIFIMPKTRAPGQRQYDAVPYQPRVIVSARRGRRTLFARPPSPRGSLLDLIQIMRWHPAERADLAATCQLTALPRGEVLTMNPTDLAEFPLRELEPIRRPPSHAKMRNFVGLYAVRSDEGNYMVQHESLLEAAHLRELDFAGQRDLNTQSVRLDWRLPTGKVLSHYPDFIVRSAGRTTIVDVSDESKLNEVERIAVFDLTALTCAQVGWNYEVGTDEVLVPARRFNLRYLSAFRDELRNEPERPESGPWPKSFWGLVEAEGGGTRGAARAAARLWRREIAIDLSQLLDDTSPLVPAPVATPRRPWVPAR